MTEVRTVDEVATQRSIPALEVPGWREAFGVVAGITTRGGSGAPFDLSLASNDLAASVFGRWQKVEEAFPEFPSIVTGRQVHGTRVAWHDHTAGWTILNDVDGHATATPGVLLTVTLADCVPIYLCDPKQRAVALLHCGWRGTSLSMLHAGLDLLVSGVGSDPADVVAHVGVGICGSCYQVSAEVANACGKPAAGPVQLDLRGVIADQARSQGIGRVSVSNHCSAHHGDRFFSHRRSGGTDGRMVAFLGIPDVE